MWTVIFVKTNQAQAITERSKAKVVTFYIYLHNQTLN